MIRKQLCAGAAAAKLAEAAQQAQGELVIAALGPLTNLALACKLDPELPSKVKRLVVMGGSEGSGNVTPCAEFNFHADPEAARLVMSPSGLGYRERIRL